MAHSRPIPQSRILICGVARNCERSLATSIDALFRAAQPFAQVRFHVVESDSCDETLRIIGNLSDRYPLTFQTEGTLRTTMPIRTDRIAHCRNRLVDLAKSREFETFDYVLMADLDGLNDNLSHAVLAGCWEVKLPWDVLTANQPEGYYDVWALRCEGWLNEDCWAAARRLGPELGKKRAVEMAVRSRQITIPADASPIEVDSAFGGLGLYRWAAFISGKFRGSAADGTEICEHVPFHADLRDAGFRIFINPALVNSAPLEHITSAPAALERMLQKFRRAAGHSWGIGARVPGPRS